MDGEDLKTDFYCSLVLLKLKFRLNFANLTHVAFDARGTPENVILNIFYGQFLIDIFMTKP